MLRSIAALCLVFVAGPSCGGDVVTHRGDAAGRDGAIPSPDAGDRMDAAGGGEDAGGLDATVGTDTGAAPAPPLRIAVLSDLNGSYGSTTYAPSVHAAVERVIDWDPDVVLSTGDMVAGQRDGLDYRAMWAGFHAAVSDPLASAGIPFAVTPGNHDASGYAAYAEERAIFVSEWQTTRKPDVEYLDDEAFPLRYSFVVGPVLFVSLDATTIGPLGGEQMTWLAEQLEAGADRPVKVVYGHVPLYAFAQGRESEIIGDAALEALVNEHGVTMLLSGHHHAYYPGKRGDLRLVGTACVGSGPRALIGVSERSERSVLLLEVEDGELSVVEAYAGETYDTVVPRSALPEEVGLEGQRIRRDDL